MIQNVQINPSKSYVRRSEVEAEAQINHAEKRRIKIPAAQIIQRLAKYPHVLENRRRKARNASQSLSLAKRASLRRVALRESARRVIPLIKNVESIVTRRGLIAARRSVADHQRDLAATRKAVIIPRNVLIAKIAEATLTSTTREGSAALNLLITRRDADPQRDISVAWLRRRGLLEL